MLFQSTDRSAMPPDRGAMSDEHNGIKRIGRLVLLCVGVLVVSSILLTGTALQAMYSIDQANLDAERQRAANAIDIISEEMGPLTADSVALLGRIAGLRNAHLSTEVSTDPSERQIPLMEGEGASGNLLTWTRSATGNTLLRKFAPIRIPIIAGMVLLMLGLLIRLRHLVTDIERQRRLAHRQSRSDVVTGLANRLAFETSLTECAAGDAPFAVLLFDLDRFKAINDAFGHAAGDDVLRIVGARLSALLGPGDLLARLGGDEFVLLSASRTERAALEQLARDCIAAIEAPVQLVGRAIWVGMSLGIVASTAPHRGALDLVAQADAALYRAKAKRGSGFCFAGDPVDIAAPKPLLRRPA
ncbi:diguanylate cyclase domain-containing protein [Devosia sp. A449]